MTRILLAWFVTIALAFPGAAQDVSQEVGKVTGFPLPRFVSMKTSIGNARRGPGFAYRIDWVFNHANTPLMVTGEHDLWRRVKDVDGEGGWMHFRLLSGVRTVVFRESGTPIYDQPDSGGLVFAYADKGGDRVSQGVHSGLVPGVRQGIFRLGSKDPSIRRLRRRDHRLTPPGPEGLPGNP